MIKTEMIDVDLLLSFFEYRASFQKPIFDALNKAEPMAALFHAFREWGVSLSDVSANPNPGNAAEYQMTIELLNRRYGFSAGLGAIRLSVTDPYWSEAERIAKVATAGLVAVRSSTQAEISQQTVQLAMHLRPRSSSICEITSRFISSDITPITSDKILAYGFSIYTENSVWIVDRSALDKSALFLSLSTSFEAQTSFADIGLFLREEQTKAMEILKLRIAESEE